MLSLQAARRLARIINRLSSAAIFGSISIPARRRRPRHVQHTHVVLVGRSLEGGHHTRRVRGASQCTSVVRRDRTEREFRASRRDLTRKRRRRRRRKYVYIVLTTRSFTRRVSSKGASLYPSKGFYVTKGYCARTRTRVPVSPLLSSATSVNLNRVTSSGIDTYDRGEFRPLQRVCVCVLLFEDEYDRETIFPGIVFTSLYNNAIVFMSFAVF